MSKLTVVVLVAWFVASPAYAYLDPGTGSMLLQGLLAVVAVGAAAVAASWSRIRQLFGARRRDAGEGGRDGRDEPQS